MGFTTNQNTKAKGTEEGREVSLFQVFWGPFACNKLFLRRKVVLIREVFEILLSSSTS